jgi:hypothetical protein
MLASAIFDCHEAHAVAAPLAVLPHALCASANAGFSDILNRSDHV